MAEARLLAGAAAPVLHLVGSDGKPWVFDPAAAGRATVILCMRAFG